ncbi:hypothetical protein [Enterococcus sp. DIV0086]|uniref:hypothetical protein n=1 Tax=Enterococcus sp. DIV0086 TaxID=2774655 RepID=UPI003D2AE258
MDELTNESKFVLETLYKEYLDKINNGISKSEAKNMNSGQTIHDALFPYMMYEDFLDSCRELGKNDFLDNKWASSKPFRVCLTDKSIVEMENKFANNIKKITNSILSLKKLLF